MAKIESKIKRPNGSKIDVGGVEYHFQPTNEKDPASPHVCEVTDEEHIATFLAIREGFKLAGAKEEAPAPAAAPDDGKDDDNGMVIMNGDEEVDLMELGKAKLMAFAKANKFKVTVTGNAQAIREEIFKQAKGE